MTAKRFTYEYDEYNGNLFDNKMNTFYHIEDSDENIEVLCDRLNWLVEENEQLKTDNGAFIQDIEVFKEENTHLKLENEELKQFIQELTTKGTGKIHLANGNIYKVNAILTDFKGDVE